MFHIVAENLHGGLDNPKYTRALLTSLHRDFRHGTSPDVIMYGKAYRLPGKTDARMAFGHDLARIDYISLYFEYDPAARTQGHMGWLAVRAELLRRPEPVGGHYVSLGGRTAVFATMTDRDTRHTVGILGVHFDARSLDSQCQMVDELEQKLPEFVEASQDRLVLAGIDMAAGEVTDRLSTMGLVSAEAADVVRTPTVNGGRRAALVDGIRYTPDTLDLVASTIEPPTAGTADAGLNYRAGDVRVGAIMQPQGVDDSALWRDF